MTLPLLMTIFLNNFLIGALAALFVLIPIGFYYAFRHLPAAQAITICILGWVLGASAADVARFYFAPSTPAAPEAEAIECPTSDGLGSEVSQ